ncbi:hypothetical protein H2248_009334 [Termitomyces sp. 'cryptogamus']|nr:hypothetical protein H2248_009334 [Termitomyces sp. 'cryptogamus']
MLTHRGFSAWIVVDGKPLPEYLIAVDSNKNCVSCWIPSEEGKSFSVYWQDHGGQVDTCSFITLDGLVVPGRFLFGCGTASRQGVRTSLSTERPFVFQKVDQAVENISALEGSSKDSGMIILRIKRVARVETHPPNPMLELPSTYVGKRKPGDHCIGFGQEARTNEQYPSTWSVVAYEEKERKNTKPSTYVSFVFRYRSREFLEAQGIITDLESETIYSSTPKQAAGRRVVSLPSTMPFVDLTMPPKKKAKTSMISQLGPGRLAPDTRRTVSLKVNPKRPGEFPGQGLLVPSEIQRESPWGFSKDNGTEAYSS